MSEIANEMKAKCMGEFSFPISDACPKCALSFPGADCACDGSGEYQKRVVVPWHTCKEIYKTMLACSPVAAQLAALKEENEAFRQERKDLIGELHRLALVEQSLKARVAELEAKNQYLRKKINSAMICDPRNIDTLLKEAIEYTHFKEPANEG